MPGPYPCCCREAYPCESDCDGGVPSSITLEIQDADNDQCTGWPNLDGSYTLDYQSCTWWRGIFTTPVVGLHVGGSCTTSPETGTYKVTIYVSFYPGELRGWVVVSGTYAAAPRWESHTFTDVTSLPEDCCGFSSRTPQYSASGKSLLNSDYGGDLSLASMLVTSDGC